jgi:hypothetical protein
MPKGGRRPGTGNPNWKRDPEAARADGAKGGCPKGGRPVGSSNKRRAYRIVKEAWDTGIMPLEVILREMRRSYALGTDEGNREACMLAQAAAPYCHPRLQAIDTRTTVEAGDTLAALMREIDGKTTGIAGLLTNAREPEVEAEQPLPLPN